MKVKVRRSGFVFIGTTVFLGVAAANTGNNLLYMVVSAMLSVMLLSGVFSLINIRGVEVKLVPPPEIFARSRAVLRVFLKKKGKIPAFLIKVSLGGEEVLFPSVGNEWEEKRIHASFPKRGRVRKVEITLSSDFPLGMFVRSLKVVVDTDFVVFPAPIPAGEPVFYGGSHKEGEGAGLAPVKGYEEFKGVRVYSGEPMKLIHWKHTAKRGEVLVKDMSAQEKEPIILSLDSVQGDTETKLSRLSYLTIRFIDEGYPVGLKLGKEELPPRRGKRQKVLILRRLALY